MFLKDTVKIPKFLRERDGINRKIFKGIRDLGFSRIHGDWVPVKYFDFMLLKLP